MKYITYICTVLSISTLHAGYEVNINGFPLVATSKSFGTSALITGACAGTIAGSAWVIKRPDIHWSLKAGAGLASAIALNSTVNSVMGNIEKLRKAHRAKYQQLYPKEWQTFVGKETQEITNKRRTKKIAKLTNDIQRYRAVIQMHSGGQTTAATYAAQRAARNKTSAELEISLLKDALNDRVHANPDEAEERQEQLQQIEGYLLECEQSYGQAQATYWTTSLPKHQAWAGLIGSVAAVTGVAVACYKKGLFAALWS